MKRLIMGLMIAIIVLPLAALSSASSSEVGNGGLNAFNDVQEW